MLPKLLDQTWLRKKVKTEDGAGIIVSYNNNTKEARVLVEGAKKSAMYQYKEIVLA